MTWFALILSILGYWYLAAAFAGLGITVYRRGLAVMVGADIFGGLAGVGVLFLLAARMFA